MTFNSLLTANFVSVLLLFVITTFAQVTPKKKEPQLKEKFRPQFHFSPRTNWTNDPNGLVYFEGEYHLFYQHFPDSNVWGPMHWGHAISSDLIHWQHLPIAMYPDSLGYIFSGSVVVDKNNTSGFGSASRPPLVAIYTYHDPVKDARGEQCQSQGIAYSTDKGRTWTKYNNNPVLKSPGPWGFRDPKVMWLEDHKKWIMTLTCGDHVCFYSSTDLIKWKFESGFGKDAGFHGGGWECPDLFPIRIETTDEIKWVLIVSLYPGGLNGSSGTQYFTGEFNGNTFIPDSKESKWLDYGADNYAGITWSDRPEKKAEPIFLGWMSNWQYAGKVPTTTWRNAMTLPRTLKLKRVGSGLILHSFPVSEIRMLRDGSKDIRSKLLSFENKITNELFEVELDLNIPDGKKLSIMLSNEMQDSVIISVDGKMVFDRRKSGVTDFEIGFASRHFAARPSGNEIRLTIFVDTSSIEIFANEGEVVMTELVFPRKAFSRISIRHDEGVEIKHAKLHNLSSIWSK